MDVLMARLLKRVRRTGGIVLATVGSSIGVAPTTGTSYLTILIPGEGFRQVYAEHGLEPKNLSRTLEDSGTVMVPLIPWSEPGCICRRCWAWRPRPTRRTLSSATGGRVRGDLRVHRDRHHPEQFNAGHGHTYGDCGVLRPLSVL